MDALLCSMPAFLANARSPCHDDFHDSCLTMLDQGDNITWNGFSKTYHHPHPHPGGDQCVVHRRVWCTFSTPDLLTSQVCPEDWAESSWFPGLIFLDMTYMTSDPCSHHHWKLHITNHSNEKKSPKHNQYCNFRIFDIIQLHHLHHIHLLNKGYTKGLQAAHFVQRLPAKSSTQFARFLRPLPAGLLHQDQWVISKTRRCNGVPTKP